jgi:hypothetical protein
MGSCGSTGGATGGAVTVIVLYDPACADGDSRPSMTPLLAHDDDIATVSSNQGFRSSHRCLAGSLAFVAVEHAGCGDS